MSHDTQIRPRRVGNGYHCDVCDCPLSSKIVMDMHLDGNRHKSAVKRYKDEQRLRRELRNYPGIQEEENGYFCLFCNSPLTSTSNVETHVNGAKHKMYSRPDYYAGQAQTKVSRLERKIASNMYAIGLDSVTEYFVKKAPESERYYKCHMCNYKCKGLDIVDHLMGTQHLVNMMQLHDPSEFRRLKGHNLSEGRWNSKLKDWAYNFNERRGSGIPNVKPLPSHYKSSIPECPDFDDDFESDSQKPQSKRDHDRTRTKSPSKENDAPRSDLKQSSHSSKKDTRRHSSKPSTSREPQPSSNSSDDEVTFIGEAKVQPKILSTIDLVNDTIEHHSSPPTSPPQKVKIEKEEDVKKVGSKEKEEPPKKIPSPKNIETPEKAEAVSSVTSPPSPSPESSLDKEKHLGTINNFKSRNEDDNKLLLAVINQLQAHCLNYELKDIPEKARQVVISNRIKKINQTWFDVINCFTPMDKDSKEHLKPFLEKDVS